MKPPSQARQRFLERKEVELRSLIPSFTLTTRRKAKNKRNAMGQSGLKSFKVVSQIVKFKTWKDKGL